ncbi:MAG: hypothetical protein K6E38_02545 [Fretibacterium sp.]|nr:hypothetical protein [Fretibacterium sp.]
MWGILWIVLTAIFVLGLIQWARSGAGLWTISSMRRKEESLTKLERKQAEEEVRRIERATDRTLMLSFKIIGILAILMWLVLGVSVLIDAFGLNDWLNDMSIRAHQYWSSGVPDRGPHSSKVRQNMLRNIGAGLRK